METKQVIILTITLAQLALFVSGQQWQSPCPSLFNYDPSGVQGDTWFGDITLRTETELSGIWMRVVLDRPPIEVSTSFGEVVQRESTEYLIRKPNNKLSPGDTQVVRLTVKFNTLEPPPRLVGFRLNARAVCPENGVIEKPTSTPEPPPPAPQFESPCPDLFTYEPLNETDRWFGVLQLKTDTELTGVWLRIVLDRESVQLGFLQNWFGEVTTGNNREYLIKKPGYKLSPGVPTPLRFFIKFTPGGPIPKVVGFQLNAKTICQGDVIIVTTTPVTGLQTSAGFIPAATRPPPQPSFGGNSPWQGNSPGQGIVECGTVIAQPRPLITNGQLTLEGEWPWHAALYRSKSTDTKYICGGSLISMKHVLTVAHCVAKVYTSSPVNPDSLVIFLGKYFLMKYNSGIQYFQAQRILIHPEYSHRTFKNDIAIIQLNYAAEFTDRVRPICLWSESTDINSVLNRDGTVVGWGFDQTGIVTENLFKTKMPVVSAQTCIYSYPEFFSRFTNDKTFCAGFRNYSSVCNGDSGGGMVFPRQGYGNRWHLRGLVSIGVALQQQATCDSKHYAVFTDVAKYLGWIRQALAS